MGVVKIVISDDDDEPHCTVMLDYDGVISDALKDFCSSENFAEVITNGLSDIGLFSENVLQ